jgi:hypothetical protein
MKKNKQGAGRPEREPWEKIRIVAWAAYVRDFPKSPRKYDDEFWNKYGDFHKSRSPIKSEFEKTEMVTPGACCFHDSLLWELSNSEQFGSFSIKTLFQSLHPDLLDFWVEDNWESSIFWRRHRNMEIELEDIETVLFNEHNYLDGLLAIAVLMHEALAHQNKKRFDFFRDSWKTAVEFACSIESDLLVFPNEQIRSYLLYFGTQTIEKNTEKIAHEMAKEWRKDGFPEMAYGYI